MRNEKEIVEQAHGSEYLAMDRKKRMPTEFQKEYCGLPDEVWTYITERARARALCWVLGEQEKEY